MGLGAQELPPAGVGMTQGRWRNPVAFEDATDCRCADTVAELEQLALDPHVSAARVLPRHPRHQRDEDVVDRRPSGRFGWVHLLGARRRCQARIVFGVTRRWRRSARGSLRMSAAKIALSAQSMRGRGLVRRRMATSWRSTRSSTFLLEPVRPIRRTLVFRSLRGAARSAGRSDAPGMARSVTLGG
jgi:hypothetical protein